MTVVYQFRKSQLHLARKPKFQVVIKFYTFGKGFQKFTALIWWVFFLSIDS